MDFSEARSLKRFPFLDAARGLACIGVVACHSNLDYLFFWYWGVMDFFFVMSGFLITRSLISNADKGRGALSFLLYRALRLLPAYVAVMLVYELVKLLSHKQISFETLPYLLFYQNTDQIFSSAEKFHRIPEFLPFWSLIIEEHFYMFWGIFFCVFAYAKLRITPGLIAVVTLMMGCSLLLRKANIFCWWTLPGRFDAFLLGSLMGIIIFMPHKVAIPEKWTGKLMACGWVLAAVSLARLLWTGWISYWDYPRYFNGLWLDVTCFSIVSVVLVLSMVRVDIRRMHFGRIQDGLAFLGLISYEIYLAHYPIVSALKRTFDFNSHYGPFVLFLVTMVISSVLAYVMHQTLTAPALKRRELIHSFFVKNFGRKSGVATAAVRRNEASAAMTAGGNSETDDRNLSAN